MQVTHSRTADAAKSPLPHVNDPVGVIKSVGPQVDLPATRLAGVCRSQGCMLSCCGCVEGLCLLVASLKACNADMAG